LSEEPDAGELVFSAGLESVEEVAEVDSVDDGEVPDELADGEPDGAPPRLRVLLGEAGRRVGRRAISGPGEAEEPAVEPDETGLDLGRPEIDREDHGLAGR